MKQRVWRLWHEDLVTGSRAWPEAKVVEQALDEVLAEAMGTDVVLVHGACPTGADYFAELYFRPARTAGGASPCRLEGQRACRRPIRNTHMVGLGADIELPLPVGTCKGTWHTTRLARRAKIPVRIVTPPGRASVLACHP